MDKKEVINNFWNYFLMLEDDLDKTSRYVEPKDQDNVFSFEFAKIIVLACTEVESVFKELCYEIETENLDEIQRNSIKKKGNIREYKSIIIKRFPQIETVSVDIGRYGKKIAPFESWTSKKLFWWNGYQNVKHTRSECFNMANYKNAVYSLSALYILILYLAKLYGEKIGPTKKGYISSDYTSQYFECGVPKKLPDFED